MRTRMVVALGILPLLVAACGGGDDDVATPNDDGVVEITMEDSRFSPNEVEVEAGQTVMFQFRNDGELDHEAFLGTEAEQEAHAVEMDAQTEDEEAGQDGDATDEHGEPGDHVGGAGVSVAPGDSGSLEHTFDEGGTILIGCHEPGHYEAGMKATVDVQ